jgi:hypothetical protein
VPLAGRPSPASEEAAQASLDAAAH